MKKPESNLYTAKLIITIPAIIICILGLFSIIDKNIALNIAFILVAVQFIIEAVRDYQKNKKGYMWLDIIAAVIAIAIAVDTMFGIF